MDCINNTELKMLITNVLISTLNLKCAWKIVYSFPIILSNKSFSIFKMVKSMANKNTVQYFCFC